MSDIVYVKKSELDESYASEMTGNEYFDFYIGTSNKRIKASEIAKHIIGIVSGALRSIGANLAGAIVTTTDAQDMSAKNLKECYFNGGDELVATSTEMNRLTGITRNVENSLVAIEANVATNTSDISDITDGLSDFYRDYASNLKVYSYTVDASSEKIEILASSINSSIAINHLSIMVKIYSKGIGGIRTEISSEGLEIAPQEINGVTSLLSITTPTIDGENTIVIYYSLL